MGGPSEQKPDKEIMPAKALPPPKKGIVPQVAPKRSSSTPTSDKNAKQLPQGLPPTGQSKSNAQQIPPRMQLERKEKIQPKQPPPPPDEDDSFIIPGPPPPPPEDEDTKQITDNANIPGPPPPKNKKVDVNYESEDTEADEDEDEDENEDEKDEDHEGKDSVEDTRPRTPSPFGEASSPPPPPPPPPPPLPDNNSNKRTEGKNRNDLSEKYDFMELYLKDDSWAAINTGDNGVFRYCQRLREAFLWLPSNCRWSRDQILVAKTREMIMNRLSPVSHKLVIILLDIRGALDELTAREPGAYDVRNDFWRWRFEQGWEKNYNNLKLAQNVDHCNQVLRASLMLLREYRGFLQFGVHKCRENKKRDPHSGLRMSKARIREHAEQQRQKEKEKLRAKELRIIKAHKDRSLLVAKQKMASQRVQSYQLRELCTTIIKLRKKIRDPRIRKRLDEEFSPAWKSSIAVSQSYVYALRHVVKLESHLAERQRRQNAKKTCQKTLKRVRKRIKQDNGVRPHVFGPALSKLVSVKTFKGSPTKPRTILLPTRHDEN